MMLVRSALGALPLLLASTLAAGCPICMGTAGPSPAQELAELPQAVIAASEGRHFRVVQVIKGERAPGVLKDVQIRAASDAGKSVLLVRGDEWPMWTSLGAVDARHASLLRQLAVRPPAEDDAAAWQRRVDLVLPLLDSREPFVAKLAYAECASAPYATLRAAKSQVDVRKVRRALADPQLASRRPLYLHLLGIVGDAGDAAAVEEQLDAAWRAHDVTNLASLLVADLELRGAPRVAWIEERYLRDTSRKTAEIEAALLALHVQGDARGVIPRARVIAGYRLFMREHPPIAGLVAPYLAEWQYWEATPEFAALLKSGVRLQYASKIAIVEYLRQSPLPAKSE